MTIWRYRWAVAVILAALAGCSTSKDTSKEDPWTLEDAEGNCAATWSAQNARYAECTCPAGPGARPCGSSLQTCDGVRFVRSAPDYTSFFCVYAASGELLYARACSDIGPPCNQFGQQIDPPAECAAPQPVCSADGGATD
jgi:hypothetical protein